nr:hypothetical protein [Chromobacterium sp. ASV5]
MDRLNDVPIQGRGFCFEFKPWRKIPRRRGGFAVFWQRRAAADAHFETAFFSDKTQIRALPASFCKPFVH